MKLPLSRDPKMRKMKKTISEAEEEIRHLKMMSKYHTLPVSTPESSPTSSIGSISTVYSPLRTTSFGSKSLTRTPSRFPRVHANQEGVSEMRSPTTAALVLAKQLDVTPRPHRVTALFPFTTTMSCVKSARTTPKKALFDPARNPNIKKKMLSIRFRRNLSKKVSLSRDYIDGVGGSIKKKVDNLVKVKSGHIMKNCAELCTTLRSVETQFNILEVLEEDVARCQKQVESWSPNAVNGLLEAHTIMPVDNTLMMRDTSCYDDCCYEGGGVFHPHCDGWRIVPFAVIRDQLDEDPRKKNSSNGRRYNLRQ